MRRLLGLLAILAGILGLLIAITGIIFLPPAIDGIGRHLDATLGFASNSLGAINRTLASLQGAVGEVGDSLQTVERAIANASQTLTDTAPLIADVADLSQNVAGSIAAFRDSVPTLADLSQTIDRTLRALGRFGLGTYNPEQPLDAAVRSIGDSFDDVPGQLHGLATNIGAADKNIGGISADLNGVAADLKAIGASIGAMPTLLDDLAANMTAAQRQIEDVRARVAQSVRLLKAAIIIFLLWLALSQVFPLYWGYHLLIEPRQPSSRPLPPARR